MNDEGRRAYDLSLPLSLLSLSLSLSPYVKDEPMYSRTYLLIRGIARSVTMMALVGLPVLAVFALEGWAQTW